MFRNREIFLSTLQEYRFFRKIPLLNTKKRSILYFSLEANVSVLVVWSHWVIWAVTPKWLLIASLEIARISINSHNSMVGEFVEICNGATITIGSILLEPTIKHLGRCSIIVTHCATVDRCMICNKLRAINCWWGSVTIQRPSTCPCAATLCNLIHMKEWKLQLKKAIIKKLMAELLELIMQKEERFSVMRNIITPRLKQFSKNKIR